MLQSGNFEGSFTMYFNDILVEWVTLLVAILCLLLLVIAVVIIPIIYSVIKKKFLWGILAVITAISLFGMSFYTPWFFKNLANSSGWAIGKSIKYVTYTVKTESYIDEAIKYDTYAVKTSLLKDVKGFMYGRLARDYLSKKNLAEGIKNQELCYKYLKNPYDLYFLAFLYSINGDYDKSIDAIKKYGGNPSLEAKMYFLKGDTDKALEILTKTIESGKGGVWDYAYRANIYDYLGKKDLAQKDYAKAEEVMTYQENSKVLREMKNNKNYHFDRIKEMRARYNLK